MNTGFSSTADEQSEPQILLSKEATTVFSAINPAQCQIHIFGAPVFQMTTRVVIYRQGLKAEITKDASC